MYCQELLLYQVISKRVKRFGLILHHNRQTDTVVITLTHQNYDPQAMHLLLTTLVSRVGWLVGRLASPISIKVGYIGDKVELS